MSNSLEIMAPAGSFEALQAALQAGADSVYFGIEQLNMRARASNNFTLDNLVEIAEICNKKNIKTYITLNTVMYDHDVSLMKRIIDKAKESGISAIIASDHAAFMYAKKINMPVHISTQANITNIESVEFFANFAETMVLSRELTLQQVAYISKEINRRPITGPSGNLIRIEIFGHGALCMAVSGKCYLSLHSHNASANRGACIQNCRRSYVVTDKEEGYELEIDNEYIMSAKDLCTIDFLDKIIEAGVQVLKIEGRGRSADYVYTTTKCYVEARNSIERDCFTIEKINSWKEQLSKVFNRGFWDGYYLGRKMGEWSENYGSKATQKKIYLGKGKKYFKNLNIGEFHIETHALKVGDQVMITGPTTGLVKTSVSELRVNDLSVTHVKKGDTFSMPVKSLIRASDKLYKIIDA